MCEFKGEKCNGNFCEENGEKGCDLYNFFKNYKESRRNSISYSSYDFDIVTYECECGCKETGDMIHTNISVKWNYDSKDGVTTITCPKCGNKSIPEIH